MKNRYILLLFIVIVSIAVNFSYKNKWNSSGGDATITWDVSGYYVYLPAIFIYQDLKKCSFKYEIHDKYEPASHPYQTFTYENGNEVAKYSIGLAVQQLPFFLMAHGAAHIFGYDTDGFSMPYQLGIILGSMFMAWMGLLLAYANLRRFFDEKTTFVTLLLLFLGTNYLNYVTIDAAMTHNYLFFQYSLLLYATFKFYEKPTYFWAIIIGVSIGLSALTRPTELIVCLIPLLWAWIHFSLNQLLSFFKENKYKILLAVLITGAIGSLQLIYWKYVGGDWIIYSYENEGFDFLSPHLFSGLFSFRKGWWIYTPMMVLPVFGLFLLYKKENPKIFIAISAFLGLVIYITFSWSIWWYGGSLGQRAMVQSYAIWIFPLAAFFNYVFFKNKWTKFIFIPIVGILVYHNIWLHHFQHKGGLIPADNVTGAYYMKVLGKWNIPKEYQKLLYTDEIYEKELINSQFIYENDFETDSLNICTENPIEGSKSKCFGATPSGEKIIDEFYEEINSDWIRISADFYAPRVDVEYWRFPQFIFTLKKEDKIVKRRLIKVSRLLNSGETKNLHLDFRMPKEEYDKCIISTWSGSVTPPIMIDRLNVISFDEE